MCCDPLNCDGGCSECTAKRARSRQGRDAARARNALRFVPSVEVHSADGATRIECNCPAEWVVVVACVRRSVHTTRDAARRAIRAEKMTAEDGDQT